MKKSTITVIILSVSLFLASCKKTVSDTSSSDAIVDDEVAAAVTQSVSASSGGVALQTQSTAQMASTTMLSCGSSSDTTIAGQSATAATITYNYLLKFSRSMVCSNGIPNAFNVNFSGKTTYSTSNMSSADSSTAQFVVTGILPTASSYTLNESYIRKGTQQSGYRSTPRSFSSTITIVSSNILVNKTTMKITGGTATVAFVGLTTSGTASTRGGTITFLGSGAATLVLDNGTTYPIAW